MRKKKDICGQQFGRLLVIGEDAPYVSPSGKSHASKWRCRCSCGNYTSVTAWNLTSGRVRSCGCMQRERMATHAVVERIVPVLSTSEGNVIIKICNGAFDVSFTPNEGPELNERLMMRVELSKTDESGEEVIVKVYNDSSDEEAAPELVTFAPKLLK